MMYVKVHEIFRNGIYEKIVAVCDEKILGKTLKEKGVDVFINPRFYKGEKVNSDGVVEKLENATITNFFGDESVKTGISSGLFAWEDVILICGVPHAQTAKII